MLPGFTPKAKGGPGASEEGLQTKFSSHSSSKQTSSKQTSTDQAPAGMLSSCSQIRFHAYTEAVEDWWTFWTSMAKGIDSWSILLGIS